MVTLSAIRDAKETWLRRQVTWRYNYLLPSSSSAQTELRKLTTPQRVNHLYSYHPSHSVLLTQKTPTPFNANLG
ncbi:hypothetical protein PTTG_25619 [Puccinia triticina 1-1 BBBD Race 1]|uniref:Uncharacterized protein n=1 Tax=Puccinia triticina (isolate 1-1 / race 1 (BBBD)) TaxID=630390 RepID=A0A180H1P7_PUCT1|nr:hypothetical protein PTTG_25619 [Puccinia triticina 1-1 BBBD Race 1]